MAKARKNGRSDAGNARPVAALKHTEAKRKNIPTQELRNFVKEDEGKPKTVLYPRDPTLDPQLVWKGKDEQDSKPLAVPAVPIYIQEKIHPQALVEDVRRLARADAKEQQTSLFADFNGFEQFSEKVDFYRHDHHWTNRMVLGDSLLVMTSLAEKEGLKGKVQTIYFDPPYGIQFGSNWQVSTRKRDVKDGKVEDATRQPEQVRAFRDTWDLGIHSYLAYFRDRMVAARELLGDAGSIFVQIGETNLHLVRCVLDEVFGSENFRSLITFRTSVPLRSIGLPAISDHIIWYAKDNTRCKFRDLFVERETGEKSRYSNVELSDGTRRTLNSIERADPSRLPANARPFAAMDLASSGYTPSCTFEFTFRGVNYTTSSGKSWKTTRAGMERLGWARRISDSGKTLRYVIFHDDFPVTKLSNMWQDTTGELDKRYVVQTHTRVIERCLLMTTDPGDLVLDPTCGSGTTAYVAEQWGRRWITLDTSRVALALARTRLMAAQFPYYLLTDSEEGATREAQVSGKPIAIAAFRGEVSRGFVYERVPHVTLESIANSPDIREGMSRKEIDDAIARHAETEYLVDRPYTDDKRVRVSGPFSVESLSPHRVLSADAEQPASEGDAPRDTGTAQFETTIIDNLRKAGVQNTKKRERLVFARLEPRVGLYLHAEGEFTDADAKSRRVAVSIGPEHGTVGPEHVKAAAKEAVKGVGYDVLVVCGFAFDPHVADEVTQFGKLKVLIARMNPDLAISVELLKKTGSGNLFMVFGEPDVDVRKQKDGNLVVEVRGVDVYDPTTGLVRSDSTDDIACWFLDTEYDEESFFVRHAYFTGSTKDGEGPFDRLKKALRAEIDESTWSALYSTTSRPFPRPSSGKIAVKVINHYGDEVLRVLDLKKQGLM